MPIDAETLLITTDVEWPLIKADVEGVKPVAPKIPPEKFSSSSSVTSKTTDEFSEGFRRCCEFCILLLQFSLSRAPGARGFQVLSAGIQTIRDFDHSPKCS
jgi:hypothetical protein